MSINDAFCAVHMAWDGVQGIDAQDQKTCDTDEGGCGQLWPIQRFLEGEAAPVFTLQLAWESHAESSEAIAEVLDAVQEVCSPRQTVHECVLALALQHFSRVPDCRTQGDSGRCQGGWSLCLDARTHSCHAYQHRALCCGGHGSAILNPVHMCPSSKEERS